MWLCVDEKFKTDSPKDVWRYFENFIKTSATSPDLISFFGAFKRLCPFDWKHKYEKVIMSFLEENGDEVLELLRGDDCAYIILLTRMHNKERKSLFTKQQKLEL